MAAVAMIEEPILTRLERLDNVLKQAEAMRNQSPKSSTASSTTGSSEGQGPWSSVEFSPKSLEKHCRPIDDVIMETELKGTLMERLLNVEDRVMKLSIQLHQELEAFKMSKEAAAIRTLSSSSPKKRLKSLVKSCVKGKGKRSS